MGSKISDDELLFIIKETAEKLGRTPMKKEVPNHHMMLNRWGSWKKTLELANLEPSRPRKDKFTDDELIKIVIQVKTILHRQGKVFSRKNYEEYLKSSKTLPSASTIVTRLGGWKNVKKIWH